MTRPRVSLALRMVAKTDTMYGDPPEHLPDLSPCWPWMGATNMCGYGIVRAERQPDGTQPLVLAHRVALSLALGRDIRPGLVVSHICDTPRCVRPSHLRELTIAENLADMRAKGRAVYVRRDPIAGRERVA